MLAVRGEVTRSLSTQAIVHRVQSMTVGSVHRPLSIYSASRRSDAAPVPIIAGPLLIQPFDSQQPVSTEQPSNAGNSTPTDKYCVLVFARWRVEHPLFSRPCLWCPCIRSLPRQPHPPSQHRWYGDWCPRLVVHRARGRLHKELGAPRSKRANHGNVQNHCTGGSTAGVVKTQLLSLTGV